MPIAVSWPRAAIGAWHGWRAGQSAGKSPEGLWQKIASIIVLGIDYKPDEDPLAALFHRDRATVSLLRATAAPPTWSKARLEPLAGWLHAETRRG